MNYTVQFIDIQQDVLSNFERTDVGKGVRFFQYMDHEKSSIHKFWVRCVPLSGGSDENCFESSCIAVFKFDEDVVAKASVESKGTVEFMSVSTYEKIDIDVNGLKILHDVIES